VTNWVRELRGGSEGNAQIQAKIVLVLVLVLVHVLYTYACDCGIVVAGLMRASPPPKPKKCALHARMHIYDFCVLLCHVPSPDPLI
jgi:hypothetical protein